MVRLSRTLHGPAKAGHYMDARWSGSSRTLRHDTRLASSLDDWDCDCRLRRLERAIGTVTAGLDSHRLRRLDNQTFRSPLVSPGMCERRRSDTHSPELAQLRRNSFAARATHPLRGRLHRCAVRYTRHVPHQRPELVRSESPPEPSRATSLSTTCGWCRTPRRLGTVTSRDLRFRSRRLEWSLSKALW